MGAVSKLAYDIIAKTIELTDDEVSLLKEILTDRQDLCVSRGETITIECLLDKLD